MGELRALRQWQKALAALAALCWITYYPLAAVAKVNELGYVSWGVPLGALIWLAQGYAGWWLLRWRARRNVAEGREQTP